jgi:hypothetical protein
MTDAVTILERAKQWAHLGAAEAISRAGAHNAKGTIAALTAFREANEPKTLIDFSVDGPGSKRTDPAPVVAALDRAADVARRVLH